MLTITRKPPADTGTVTFSFDGNIDAQASDSLGVFYGQLPEAAVRLDFTGVQRVNSMGLALLLKLFEHCNNQGIGIEVAHANRMTSMLFKMTNLESYLADAGTQQTPSKAVKPATAALKISSLTGTPASLHRPADEPAENKPPANPATPNGKLAFLANMQSGRQMNGWYFFNTYLQRHLGREIHLDLVHPAWDNELRPDTTHLVFAQPFQATRLKLEHGFHLAARPTGQADEITILARVEDGRRELADFALGKVVTDREESFVYLLGRFMLDENGLASTGLDYRFTGHEIKAVRTLLDGDADLLFLPTESYKGLSALTRSRLRPLEESDSGLAFHSFCLSPTCSSLLPSLREFLLDMSMDAKGLRVLEDLDLTGWSEPETDEVNMLTLIYERYVVSK